MGIDLFTASSFLICIPFAGDPKADDAPVLPDHLSHHDRDTLKINPEVCNHVCHGFYLFISVGVHKIAHNVVVSCLISEKKLRQPFHYSLL